MADMPPRTSPLRSGVPGGRLGRLGPGFGKFEAVAQTKKKRSRKRRGTQAGSIDSRRRSRPRNRAEARNQARAGSKRDPRKDAPPTWKGAIIRGVAASAIFVVLLLLLFGQGLKQALPIGIFMLVFYIPAGYYMDLFMWRRRERARIRANTKG